MKIAKKYLKSASGIKSYLLVRKWIYGGNTVRDVVETLTAAYGEAKEKDKVHIDSLLAMAYDFDSPKFAEKCLSLIGETKEKQMSVGQTVYLRKSEREGCSHWDKEYSESAQRLRPLVEEFDTERWRGIIYEEHSGRVLTIDREDNIFAFRSSDGSVTLFILNDCKDDMLIDESSFMGAAPLYFTENTHFVSPVFKINMVGKILDYCLAIIGYPYVKVKKEVVFTSPSANLMNIDDYTRLDVNGRDWDGVTVGFSAKHPCPYFYNCIHFLEDTDKADTLKNNLLGAMVDSLGATSILYKRIKIEFEEDFEEIDDKLLKRLSGEEEIFL